MRRALLCIALVAGCSNGGGSTPVTPSSVPPVDAGVDGSVGTRGGGADAGLGPDAGRATDAGSAADAGGAPDAAAGTDLGGVTVADLGNPDLEPPSSACPPTPVTFATTGHPGALAVDATWVYWIDSARPWTIYRAPQTGGPPEPLTHDTYSTLDGALYLAVDGAGVYWASTTYPGGQSAGHSLVYALRPDGHVDTLAESAATLGFALSDSTLFFSDRFGVYSVPTAGGARKTLLDQFGEGSIAVDPWHVFALRANTLLRLDRDGANPTTLGSHRAFAVAVDFNRAYLATDDGVYAIPPASGQLLSPPVNSQSPTLYPFLFRDGATLYYSTPQNELARLATDGSGWVRLAPFARAAAIAGNTLYYSHDGSISAVCK
jgi:hypothetical protein